MTLLDRLESAASDTATLNHFLSNNALEIIDFFNNLPYSEVRTLHDRFREFVLLKRNVWGMLPQTDDNLAFLTLLLEKADQLGDHSSFHHLYQFLNRTTFATGSRLQAAALYLDHPPATDAEFLRRYVPMYERLAQAVEHEDDNPDKALSTIIQYYLVAVESFGSFNPSIVQSTRNLLVNTVADDSHSFLNCPLIENVLAVDFTDPRAAATEIRRLLDEYLNRVAPFLAVATGHLVEDGTLYCALLAPVDPDFVRIREISVREHQSNPRNGAAYRSLNRGTIIISEVEQLYAYMTAYGLAHSAKLSSAFDETPFSEMVEPITVIDWGCGQGTATMMLFDHFQKGAIDLEIHEVILIEPSAVALRRGGRHSLKFDDATALLTINKSLDDLRPDDFKKLTGTFIHLFSNILDVDAVSLVPLVHLIKRTFSGVNYFVCVSPYIDDRKKQRLDTFMNSFALSSFEKYQHKDNRAGTWKNDWTRVSRVFKAGL